MGDIKLKYPVSSADTVALTITLASLASDTNFLAGREGTAVDNRTDLDLDHLVSGVIFAGTSPTAAREIRVYAVGPRSIASGTPTWPDVFDGTDSNETITSANVRDSMIRLLWSTATDNTSDRGYEMPPTSIRQAFGGMPAFWLPWVVHSTGVNLKSSGHVLGYQRIQRQY